jgi:hypothetical protein
MTMFDGFRYRNEVKTAYCCFLGMMPDHMKLYQHLDRDGNIKRWIEHARTVDKMTAEEAGLMLANQALGQMFSSIEDKSVMQTAIDRVWAIAGSNYDFRWFAEAYRRVKEGRFDMPEGMTILTLAVGFLFWYADKMAKDGKIRKEIFSIALGDLDQNMNGVVDPNERSRQRFVATLDSCFAGGL